MKLKEWLSYTLIDTKSIDITLYHIFISVLILIIAISLLYVIKRIINRRIKRNKLDRGTGYSIRLIIKYIVWILVIGLILETIGVKLTLLIAGSAALLVGLGLGLQQIFRDIVSGFFMLFERSLKVNDVVQLDDGTVGRVVDISLRTSKIKTRDNIIMIVPNSKFISDPIINWSHIEEKTRFNVTVGVAYGSDVRLVEKVLLDVAEKNNLISSDPRPFVRFNDFGDSSLEFQLYFWTIDAFWVENIKSNLRFSIDAAFRENGIHIPFPQRDVHIKSRES